MLGKVGWGCKWQKCLLMNVLAFAFICAEIIFKTPAKIFLILK